MVQDLTPLSFLGGGVPSVAFIGYYKIEGMNRYVELFRVFFSLRFAWNLGEHTLLSEKVDSHPLNRAYIDESVLGLGIRQVFGGKDVGVELVLFWHVLATETLA